MKINSWTKWLYLAGVLGEKTLWEAEWEANPHPGARDHMSRDYFVAVVENPAEIEATLEEAFPIPNHWLFSTPKGLKKRALDALSSAYTTYDSVPRRLQKRLPLPMGGDGCLARRDDEPEPKELQAVKAEFGINDPHFRDQWHIYNHEVPGHDMNILSAWRQNVTGKDVVVAVVDDGIDYDHPDFLDSFYLDGSWDYNVHRNLPTPELSIDGHGTRCAGEIAAGFNDVCGVGIAPSAKVAGIRILSGELEDVDQARALSHKMQENDIYSCSWGPADDGKTIEGPPAIVRRSIVHAIEQGRAGRGSIYVFASGNGFYHGDNCNYDGYTNSIYSITIAAVDENNKHPYYSESCSANMAVTYSSNLEKKITTSAKRNKGVDCTDEHSGTSAAAPIAAGILALALEVRPELTWRDMQYVVRDAAVPFDIPTATEAYNWTTTHDGKLYHNDYGYGLLDAASVIERATNAKLVKPQTWHFTDMKTEDAPINSETVESTISVSKDDLDNDNFERLEHVTVVVNVDHEKRGVLGFSLESPSGFHADLAAPRKDDSSKDGIHNWTFSSVAHWGEKADGDWKLKITGDPLTSGKLISWQLKLWGESKDASKAIRYSEVWDKYESPAEVFEGGNENPETAASTLLPAPTSTQEPEKEPEVPTTTEPPAPAESTEASPTAEPTDSPDNKSSRHGFFYYLAVGSVGAGIIALVAIPAVWFALRRQRSNVTIDDGDFALVTSDIELSDFGDNNEFVLTDDEDEQRPLRGQDRGHTSHQEHNRDNDSDGYEDDEPDAR